jgi:DNA-binding IclR family transcriptional regulator
VESSFPLRSHVLHEGIRFPLGVASAGPTLLAYLPLPDAQAYLVQRGAELAAAYDGQHDTAPLKWRVTATRKRGYAVNPGLIVPGGWGIGAVMFDRTARRRGHCA